MSGQIRAQVFAGRRCVGFVIRSGTASYAYSRDGTPIGAFADMDAAALELRRRAAP